MPACSLLIFCLAYSPTLKMEVVRSCETLNFTGLHYVTFQNIKAKCQGHVTAEVAKGKGKG
jgi:hypothetical protein